MAIVTRGNVQVELSAQEASALMRLIGNSSHNERMTASGYTAFEDSLVVKIWKALKEGKA
jgi:hypothetical protein